MLKEDLFLSRLCWPYSALAERVSRKSEKGGVGG